MLHVSIVHSVIHHVLTYKNIEYFTKILHLMEQISKDGDMHGGPSSGRSRLKFCKCTKTFALIFALLSTAFSQDILYF